MILALARDLGFDRCGCAPAVALERAGHYRRWLEAGCAGTMAYLHRHAAKRTDASLLLPGARSVIVVALSYNQDAKAQPAPPAGRRTGRVAMYAWGDDYHRIVKSKLFALVDRLRERIAEPFDAKVCVDTAPLCEREYAMLAGIGWIGKNTLVLDEKLGSYFFLGEIVTTLELPVAQPSVDRCGRCTRCLDACPTGALVRPHEMDASRCISYLTIEHRQEAIAADLGDRMGKWVFGCDLCQEACPHNRRAAQTREPRFAIRGLGPEPDLDEMIRWTDDDYRRILAGSAIKRAKPDMLLRNARIALGNATD